ncbi:MAG: DUF1385 domain-containing protein [Bryobacteraceae bacterium]
MSLRSSVRLFTQIQLLPVMESGEETLVGGQAVMEGVMMRAPHSYCVAVRRPGGEIVTEQMPLARISETHKIFKLPLFRGVGTLFQAMKLGMKALRFSTNQALEDLAEKADAPAKPVPDWVIAGPLLFSLAAFIVMYKVVPVYLANQLHAVHPVLAGHFASTVVEGIIRISILVGFVYCASLMKDMRRMFEYHGAEHKVVFNFESHQPVTVENAQRFTTYHPRCGTSFLIVMMILTIPVYALIPYTAMIPMILTRIALIPVVVGLSYEIIRFAAKHPGSLLSVITAPGLWLQRITTKPPADDQAAVAIHALEGAMALEEAQGGELVIA